MITPKLHIVSFDVPFPPNYGGVIDVFYKIKALHELGVEIYLHIFEYGRGKPQELEQYCKKVFYYQRKKSYFNFLSTIPYVVKTRFSQELIKNLHAINAPILFEGLHSTYILKNKLFYDRKILIRAHNIEHDYYKGLYKSETNLFKKLYFFVESIKLKNYESILNKVTHILTISPFEQHYFYHKFSEKAIYIPVFHQNTRVQKTIKKGSKILYHGDLRVADNIKVALFLIDVFSDFQSELTIASSFENNIIQQKITQQKNINFVKINSQSTLDELFKETHINILLTYQKTGIKLKLINSLYQGKFIVANTEMIEDTGLESLCKLANSKQEIRANIKKLMSIDFTDEMIENRQEKLQSFNTQESAKKILKLLY